MTFTLRQLLIAVLLLGLASLYGMHKAFGSEYPRQPEETVIQVKGNSDCALGVAMGQHRYRTSTKLVGSASFGYCGSTTAYSVGLAGETEDFLYTFSVGIDDTSDNNTAVGGSIGWTFN